MVRILSIFQGFDSRTFIIESRATIVYDDPTSNPVDVIALIGEVTHKQAERNYKKLGSIAKALLRLEAKKKRNKFWCLCCFLFWAISFLLLVTSKHSRKYVFAKTLSMSRSNIL